MSIDLDIELVKASGNGHLDVVKFLVEKGANVHAKGDQALHWASEECHLDVVNFLQNVMVVMNKEKHCKCCPCFVASGRGSN